jgi:putative nucleotidyltransferase with HDIG domain
MAPTREQAWKLLNEYTHTKSLLHHALAVEAAMRFYAAKFEGDVEQWGVAGLIHDFDYEQHPTPEEHPAAGVRILTELGWPKEIIDAVAGHGWDFGVPRETMMAKSLFAVDELTGFIAACALVRPSKSILDLTASSVRKKWKDKAFARNVSREDMERGAQEIGVPLEEHIANVIAAMAPVADELGLAGQPQA